MAHKSGVNTAELGSAIRRRREQQGMSLRDLADETGVSASTLSRIENGTGKPDADNIARLTNWLDMPLERIAAFMGVPLSTVKWRLHHGKKLLRAKVETN